MRQALSTIHGENYEALTLKSADEDLILAAQYFEMVRRLLHGQSIDRPAWHAIAIPVTLPEIVRKSPIPLRAVQPNPHQFRHEVNYDNLKETWDASQSSTEEDWIQWMRRLSLELLKESPHQALRACYR